MVTTLSFADAVLLRFALLTVIAGLICLFFILLVFIVYRLYTKYIKKIDYYEELINSLENTMRILREHFNDKKWCSKFYQEIKDRKRFVKCDKLQSRR